MFFDKCGDLVHLQCLCGNNVLLVQQFWMTQAMAHMDTLNYRFDYISATFNLHCFTVEHLYFQNVKLHYVAAGDESKPLMLFLHGFPEFWLSWRHQLKEFQKDFRYTSQLIDNY